MVARNQSAFVLLGEQHVFNALVKWRMWLNINDLATDCAGLLIPKWACM